MSGYVLDVVQQRCLESWRRASQVSTTLQRSHAVLPELVSEGRLLHFDNVGLGSTHHSACDTWNLGVCKSNASVRPFVSLQLPAIGRPWAELCTPSQDA